MNHFADVSNFFKGAHVELNARNEEDVEPSALMCHVAKLSSRIKVDKADESTYNDIGGRNPVGTNYKRIVPQNEISKKERESFWQKQKQEEEERLNELKRKEKDRKLDMTNVKREESSDIQVKCSQNNQIRKERLDEAKSLISKNSINTAKAFFEQNSAASQLSHKSEPVRITTSNEFITNEVKQDSQQTYLNHTSNKQINGNSSIHKEDEIDDVAEKVVEEANSSTLSTELTDDVERGVENQFQSDSIDYSNQYYYSEPRTLENIEEEPGNCNYLE